MSLRSSQAIALAVLAGITAAACGGEKVEYKPHPEGSGVKANLPAVPALPKKPIKNGDEYTVWGAGYHLRSRVHRKDIVGKKVTITGYVTKTNLPDAPECAVHKGGKADPENCKPPIPTFWISDSKDAKENESIKVMGWASNYAQIFDAIDEYDKGKEDAEYMDTFWGNKLPKPLPAVGAKVRVSGTYSSTFTQSSTGAEADPIMGIITYREMTELEPAPELATLPGKKRKPPKG